MIKNNLKVKNNTQGNVHKAVDKDISKYLHILMICFEVFWVFHFAQIAMRYSSCLPPSSFSASIEWQH